MFSTTSQLTASSDLQAHDLHAVALTACDLVDEELNELRMLTRAGEMHVRDAASLIAGLEQRIAGRASRRATLGAAWRVSTFDLERWHGDDRDDESRQLRVELQASGLL